MCVYDHDPEFDCTLSYAYHTTFTSVAPIDETVQLASKPVFRRNPVPVHHVIYHARVY